VVRTSQLSYHSDWSGIWASDKDKQARERHSVGARGFEPLTSSASMNIDGFGDLPWESQHPPHLWFAIQYPSSLVTVVSSLAGQRRDAGDQLMCTPPV
jgi:hypothetical protein